MSAPPKAVRRPSPAPHFQSKRTREAIIAATGNYKEEQAPHRIGLNLHLSLTP